MAWLLVGVVRVRSGGPSRGVADAPTMVAGARQAPTDDERGPASLASGAGDESDLLDWARRATPIYLNLRKASIYGGSNEIQRQIIAKTILGL